ncbi:hypothetical protein CAI21_04485 [Alkalilimnicola ehrlichii]|uniref:DUF2288 domain-containing protein n=1 Tax=Alkalilimnicola ehrlichii TaxID=351052 RepID=A0A3E0WZ84_9GAMM|nr:DUF2288 domain-containing protein [Alkalilimnicola ehrlichii]RFA30770.1 hypothetical protein CAI21_04485 [Alkalilimnicola ehrlichii]RFA38346.1 hypothetical protein CAL65_05850 [Alkalilimnicola ehrlichii]
MASQEPDTRAILNAETAKIGWQELERHFARGAVITVDRSLDLIEVGARIINDDKPTVEQWLQEDQIRRTTSDEARRWSDTGTELWCVVVAPWVLVQEPAQGC